MPRASLAAYRKQWPRIGGVLAMAVGGATTLAAKKMTKPQLLSAVNFGAVLVHQYEEYVDPGWFPGQFNKGLFRSDSPRNYPLNTNTALCVNTAFAYPFYIAPVLFPKNMWLGLGPVLFGISQAFTHGVVFPLRAGDKYSPGFLASILLHVPIGTTYLRAVRAGGGLTRGDWVRGILYTLTFAAVGVAGSNIVGSDKNSPYAFDPRQMGRYDTAPATDLVIE